MGGFFPHLGLGAGTVGFTSLAETTYSGVLDSIVSDIGGGVNGWTLFDDMRFSGSSFPIIAYGNVGGVDSAPGSALCDWNTGSVVPNTGSRWTIGNCINTEAYPGRTQISFGPTSGTFYTIQNVPITASGNVNSTSWGFNIDRVYAGASFTTSNYYVKITKYIVLKQTSAQKSFYVLLMRPDSACDILRIQVFETWDASQHTGTVGSNQEILRGTDAIDMVNWNQNWDNQPVKYMLWLLPDALGLWAGFGSGLLNTMPGTFSSGTTTIAQTYCTRKSDFAYVGNLNVSAVRSNDPNAVFFACSNTTLSGFGMASNQSFNTAYTANGLGGNFAAGRMLRTLAGEPWMMPISGSNQRPQWPPSNQYSLWPRGMPYHYRVDSTPLDQGGRLQFCELDVYNLGAGLQSTANSVTTFGYPSPGGGTNLGAFPSEGKRGEIRYLRLPCFNPSGLHLATTGPADDGNTYIIFKASLPAVVNGGTQSPITSDVDTNTKMSAWTLPVGAKPGTLGEVTTSTGGNIAVIRFFMMPTNL